MKNLKNNGGVKRNFEWKIMALFVVGFLITLSYQAQVLSYEFETNASLEEVFVPTAFTPDGDGLNDIFKVEANGDLLYFDLQIFDQWGTRVFITDDPKTPWLGNNMDGDYSAGEGLFLYQLLYSYNRGVVEEKNGAVYMLR